MIGEKINPKTAQAIAEMSAEGLSLRVIAKRLGVSTSSAARYGVERKPEEPESKRTFVERGDAAELSYRTPHRIKTEEDALRYGEVDTSVWSVAEMRLSSWEVVAKGESLTEDKRGKIWKLRQPQHHHLWGVQLQLKRIMPKPYLDAVNQLFDAKRWPKAAKLAKPNRKPDPIMMMFGLFDAHFGKLAWAPEAGDDYDLAIAERVYRNAVEDLLARVSHMRPEKILFPVGNDFVHIDTKGNTTTAGTPVSTDSRHPKIIRTAFRAQVEAVERLAALAPVDVFHVPGNHDELGSYYLAMALDARFRNEPHVSVDLNPASRKYRRYGDTLLGFTHGDRLKAHQLPKLAGVMMDEQRDELKGTRWSEWFTGHNHRSMKYEDTHQGTVVRSLASLSGTDDYHFDNGFVGSRRAAEVYVYERSGGYCGHWIATAR